MAKTLILRDLARRPELRADGPEARLVGYGAVFNERTDIAGLWIEEIAPGAFAEAIAAGADVRALFNHVPDHILGRTTAGTLALTEDETGLRYEITPPNTTLGRDLTESIRRGDVTGSSIGFTVKAEEWVRAETPEALPLRRITAIDWLRDVGPVTFPAYDQTTAEAEARSQAARLRAAPAAPDLAENERLLLLIGIDEVE